VFSYVIKSNSDVPVGIEKTDRFTSLSLNTRSDAKGVNTRTGSGAKLVFSSVAALPSNRTESALPVRVGRTNDI